MCSTTRIGTKTRLFAEVRDGDFFYIEDWKKVICWCNCGSFFEEIRGMIQECFIWLPRQDQLQEMVSLPNSEKIGIWFEKQFRFYEWAGKKYNKNELQNNWGTFKSMEQLWLAFVMKERFSKQWSGKEWVNA